MGCLAPYFRSFDRVLRGENKSARTRQIYLGRAKSLDDWLELLPTSYTEMFPDTPEDDLEDDIKGLPVPQEPGEVSSGHISAYIATVIKRTSDATGSNHYRALQQFFKYLALEEVIDRDPFTKLKPPKVIPKPVPVIPDDALTKLLATCKGRDLVSLRDKAIIMVFIDTGMRLAESAGLNYAEKEEENDVDFTQDVLGITVKGGRRRAAPFGTKTGLALERYIRKRNEVLRNARKSIDGPLWIGSLRKDRLTIFGISQMLERRCIEAGIQHINPHRFRHTFAHQWMREDDGDETNLMRLMGWHSRQMLSRYGASAADERAREAHRKKSPGDRF